MLHAARTPENVTSFISLLYHKFINFWGFRCCQYKLHILIDSWNPDETFKLSHPKKMPSKSKSQNENEIKGTKLYWELKNQCNDKNRYAACDRKIFFGISAFFVCNDWRNQQNMRWEADPLLCSRWARHKFYIPRIEIRHCLRTRVQDFQPFLHKLDAGCRNSRSTKL